MKREGFAEMAQKNPNLKRNIGIAIGLIIMLIIAVVVGIYFMGGNGSSILNPSPATTSTPILTPTPIPFDYHLDVSPTSGTVQQGNSIQTTVTIISVQGSPETVTLSASGGPNGATYSFDKVSGIPNEEENGGSGYLNAFTRTITIIVFFKIC